MAPESMSKEERARERLAALAATLLGTTTKVEKQIQLRTEMSTLQDIYDFLVRCIENGFHTDAELVEPVVVYIERWVR